MGRSDAQRRGDYTLMARTRLYGNYTLPIVVLEALQAQADEEGIYASRLAERILRQGLGMPPPPHYERRSTLSDAALVQAAADALGSRRALWEAVGLTESWASRVASGERGLSPETRAAVEAVWERAGGAQPAAGEST